jgi:hypothetical protein
MSQAPIIPMPRIPSKPPTPTIPPPPVNPLPIAPSALQLFVSMQGSDSNPGTQDRPLRTLAKTRSLFTHGRPTWIRPQCGGAWSEPLPCPPGGPDPNSPSGVAGYGAGPPPKIDAGTQNGCFTQHAANLYFGNLHLTTSARRPGEPVFTAEGFIFPWCSNVVIADCIVDSFRTGITFEGDVNTRAANLAVRRCRIVDNFNSKSAAQNVHSGGHGEGIFADFVDGILIEDCLLDHNGWGLDKAPDMFNHGFYCGAENGNNVTVRRNIFSNNSSHGLQARAGGIVEDNFFWNNAYHMSYGLVNGSQNTCHAGGVVGVVRRNVCWGSHDISGSSAGVGIEIDNVLSATVADNLFVHGGPGPAIFLHRSSAQNSVGLRDLTLAGNRAAMWTQPAWMDSYGPSELGQVMDDGNSFRLPAKPKVVTTLKPPPPQYVDPQPIPDFAKWLSGARAGDAACTAAAMIAAIRK